MAHVTLKNGLVCALSGKFGNMVYRTLKSGKIIASFPPKPRTTPLSNKERTARQQFSLIAGEVARRMRAGDKRPKSVIWQEVKSELLQRQVRVK